MLVPPDRLTMTIMRIVQWERMVPPMVSDRSFVVPEAADSRALLDDDDLFEASLREKVSV